MPSDLLSNACIPQHPSMSHCIIAVLLFQCAYRLSCCSLNCSNLLHVANMQHVCRGQAFIQVCAGQSLTCILQTDVLAPRTPETCRAAHQQTCTVDTSFRWVVWLADRCYDARMIVWLANRCNDAHVIVWPANRCNDARVIVWLANRCYGARMSSRSGAWRTSGLCSPLTGTPFMLALATEILMRSLT